jgi:diguanylate cyclase (GGDEF)-like protein
VILSVLAVVALIMAATLLVTMTLARRQLTPMLMAPVMLASFSAALWAVGAGLMQLVLLDPVMYVWASFQVYGAWGVVASYVWLVLVVTYRSHLLTTSMLALAALPPSTLVALMSSQQTRDLVITVTVSGSGPDVEWGNAFWAGTVMAAAVMLAVAASAVSLATETVQGQRPLVYAAMATTLPAAAAWFFFIADHGGQKLAPLSPTLLSAAMVTWLVVAIRSPNLVQLPITVDRLLAEVNDGIIICTDSGTVLDVNQAARSLVRLNTRWEHFSDADLGPLPDPGTSASVQMPDSRVLELVAARVDLAGRAPTIVVTVRDITELAQLRAHLTDVASRDPMTGARNRRFLDDRLAQLVEQAKGRFPLSIVMFDVDRFKAVNDTYGRAMGDRVIIGIADEVWSTIPPGGDLVRMGGDEFAVVLPGMDRATANRVADRISARCADLQFATHRQPVSVEVSTGVAELRTDMCPDALLREADHALYEAKRSRRGSVPAPEPVRPPTAPVTRVPRATRPRVDRGQVFDEDGSLSQH